MWAHKPPEPQKSLTDPIKHGRSWDGPTNQCSLKKWMFGIRKLKAWGIQTPVNGWALNSKPCSSRIFMTNHILRRTWSTASMTRYENRGLRTFEDIQTTVSTVSYCSFSRVSGHRRLQRFSIKQLNFDIVRLSLGAIGGSKFICVTAQSEGFHGWLHHI